MRLQEDLSIVLEIQNWGENFIVEFRLWGILRLNFLFKQMQIAANVAVNNLVETQGSQ